MLQNVQSHFKKSFFVVVIRTRIVNIYVINKKSAAKRNYVLLKNFNDHFNELNNRINNFLRKFNHFQKLKRNHKNC